MCKAGQWFALFFLALNLELTASSSVALVVFLNCKGDVRPLLGQFKILG